MTHVHKWMIWFAPFFICSSLVRFAHVFNFRVQRTMGYKFLCRWNHIVGFCFFVTHSPQKRAAVFMNFFLMPCPFAGPKIFCASPNFLIQPKNLTAFYWMQIIFLSGPKCLWLPQYVNKFLVWHQKFGPAQNILGPVKGQGISL